MSNEVAAWRDIADLIDTPDELAAHFATLDRITADSAARSLPPATTLGINEYLHGEPLDRAVDLADESIAAAARHDRTGRFLAQAQESQTFLTRVWVATHRADLIGGPLRDAVNGILDKATPLASKLWADHGIDEESILASGSKPQIEAWRDSRPLDTALGRLRKAWLLTWKTATNVEGTSPQGFPNVAHLPPDRAGGIHVWANPSAVTNRDVASGEIDDVIAIAHFHAAGGEYRLATADEIEAVDRRWKLEPLLSGSGYPTKIWFPGDEKTTRDTKAASWTAA